MPSVPRLGQDEALGQISEVAQRGSERSVGLKDFLLDKPNTNEARCARKLLGLH